MQIWVNVFLAPLNKNRFYLSMSYPTREAALAALGKGKSGNKNQTYVATIPVRIPAHAISNVLHKKNG